MNANNDQTHILRIVHNKLVRMLGAIPPNTSGPTSKFLAKYFRENEGVPSDITDDHAACILVLARFSHQLYDVQQRIRASRNDRLIVNLPVITQLMTTIAQINLGANWQATHENLRKKLPLSELVACQDYIADALELWQPILDSETLNQLNEKTVDLIREVEESELSVEVKSILKTYLMRVSEALLNYDADGLEPVDSAIERIGSIVLNASVHEAVKDKSVDSSVIDRILEHSIRIKRAIDPHLGWIGIGLGATSLLLS